MEHGDILKAGGFFFLHNFDSGNLGHVEQVPTELIQSSANHRTNNLETPDFEFNVWTRPDCAGTQFENGNRTWFYFGVQGGQANALVRLNIINLNKQGKMYNQGMAPVTRTLPGQPHWERIRDRPLHSTDDNTFTLTFKYRTPDNIKATTFFAFTYPFSFAELQIALNSIDLKFLPPPLQPVLDDIYYCRENLVYSLEGRRMDLLTISSYHGVTSEREERLKYLFPDNNERPFKFLNKKVIFVSARVHPGETPSSFVFNGFLNLLLTRNDPIALQLRKLYVFKLVPFLNPDGVARGHYRTDTRGVNLNRVYLNPSIEHHPTVFAARALIRYHHFGHEKDDDFEDSKNMFQPYSRSLLSVNEEATADDVKKKKPAPAKQKDKDSRCPSPTVKPPAATSNKSCGPRRLPGADAVDAASRSGDTLAEQVCDLKLQEIKSELKSDSITSGKTKNNSSSTTTFVAQPLSLLDAVVVRDCLGSEVHLSRSDELNFQGPNPLRQLRDTLKNSISLLIGANGYRITPSDSTSQKEEMKLGWCRDCKNAISETEENSDENLVSMITLNQNPSSETGVWREESMFCSSCLKRYNTSELEEEIMAKDRLSRDSVAVGGDAQARAGGAEPPVDSTGDTIESKAKVPPKARKKQVVKPPLVNRNQPKEQESGLYLYIDLHGHASKKGIFMYGNYFEEMEASVECMLLPRIMSLNNLHFHFSSCNFTERNMYLKDRRDGMSREGSGRVAVLKATGLVRSYTLECNYNTGRLVNVLPPTVREAGTANGPSTSIPSGVASAPLAPPKYSPHIFEEVGRSLGASILDLTGHHPNSRIPSSEHRTLGSLRDWLRSHSRSIRPPQLTVSRLRPKAASPQRAPLYARSLTKTKLADVERKENTYIGAKPEGDTKKPATARSGRSNELIVERFTVKKSEKPYVPRPRYFAESEPKPKSLSAKRRNVLAIRKPNAGKARSVGGVKSKSSHRRGEESEATVSPKVSKASAAFGVKTYRRESAGRAPPSTSSSEEVVRSWEEVAGGTGVAPVKRRPSALPAPRLKKIRLKTAS